MLLLLCLLVVRASDSSATIPIAPAPGAPAISAIRVSASEVHLDNSGHGSVARDADLSSEIVRFYETAGGEAVFYYPAGDTLVSTTIQTTVDALVADVFAKQTSASWQTARKLQVPVEPGRTGFRLRFVLEPGDWDLALLVPGSAPAFANGVRAGTATLEVGPLRLGAAGRVKARILDARTGKPPSGWEAYVSKIGADPKTDEARFFSQRPIAASGSSLDFGSLPVGGWDLRVESPGRSKPRKPVNISGPGVFADLGDVYVTDLGKLRLVLEFPDEIPPANFEVKLTSSAAVPPIDLGSRTVRAAPEAAAEFGDIEPGDVDIECSSKEMHIWRLESAVVEPDRTAEVRIVVHPLHVHGTVRHGDQVVAGAKVSWLSGRKSVGEPPPVTSDALGVYDLKAWAGEDKIGLAALSPGEETSYVEFVDVDRESTDLSHDIVLPANEIRGVVRDSATGATLEGATVVFTTALDQKEPDENATSFMIQQKTDADGRFRLANLTEGAVDVAVSLTGYSTARFPTVRPTKDGIDLDVRLGKGARIFGVVTDETGAPLPAVMVGLDVEPQGQLFAETASTAGDGSYEFKAVEAGSHVLGLIRCTSTIVLRPFVVISPSGDDSGDQREDVQLGREGAPLTVRFVKADGTPAEKKMFRWAIDGAGLPMAAWDEVLRTCGYPEPAETDRLLLHGFPRGAISALSFYSQKSFGTFVNDGSQPEWIIRLPAAEEKRGEKLAQENVTASN
jgi:hypothetical protein